MIQSKEKQIEKATRIERASNLSIEACMKEMFDAASGLVFNEQIDEIDFQLCFNTIQITLTYLKDKRDANDE